MRNRPLPPGAEKYCAGLLELYKDKAKPGIIKIAEDAVGHAYSSCYTAQQNRETLVKMVKLNLINRKKYPREWLNRKYEMNICKDELTAEKKKFCNAILSESGINKLLH